LGWPGEAAWAVAAFSPKAKKNLKYLAILFGFHSNSFSLRRISVQIQKLWHSTLQK
jgi:hypothetical protein